MTAMPLFYFPPINNPDYNYNFKTTITTIINTVVLNTGFSNKNTKTVYTINDKAAPIQKSIMLSRGSDYMDIRTLQNYNKLDDFSKLQYDWNENGAEPFSQRMIAECRELLELLPNQPEIFPTAANSIQFEYDKSNGDYLEFNVFSDCIEIFKIIDDQEYEDTLELNQKSKLQKIVRDFYD